MTKVLYANDKEIASKVMDGEAILINLSTGIYYSLDEVGSCIWSAIEHGATIEQIADLVCASFDASRDQVLKDLEDYTGTLTEEGLTGINDEESSTGPVIDTPESKATYVTPKLEKFDDMAEMFALDPPLPGLTQDKND